MKMIYKKILPPIIIASIIFAIGWGVSKIESATILFIVIYILVMSLIFLAISYGSKLIEKDYKK